MIFHNPRTGEYDSCSAPWFWCLIFGPAYLIYKGLLGWGILAAIVAACTAFTSLLVFPFFARRLVRGAYLRAGWVEVTNAPAPGILATAQASWQASNTSPATDARARIKAWLNADV